MWRDRWFVVGVIGAAVACLMPVVAVILGAIGLGAWVGRFDFDLVVAPALVAFAARLIYRYQVACWRAP